MAIAENLVTDVWRLQGSAQLELDRLVYAIRIFEADCEELERCLWFFCENPNSEELYFAGRRRAWARAIAEVIFLLHNCVTSGSNLISDSLCVCDGLYRNSGPLRACERDEACRTAKEEVVEFLQEFSDYCVHHQHPVIGTTMTFVDLKRDKVIRQVTVARQDLIDFDWSDEAKSFLDQADESIDLRKTFEAYRDAVRSCYNHSNCVSRSRFLLSLVA